MNKTSELIGPNGKKPPAIFWRDLAQQFMAYIGYHIANKGKKAGSRVRTAHYLGHDKREATLNAILIDRRWDRVCANCREREASVRQMVNSERFEDLFGSRRQLPVWPAEELKSQRKREPEQIVTAAAILAVPDDDECDSERSISIAELRDKFLQTQKARVGLIGKRGLKENSYRSIQKSLGLALRGLDTGTNALKLARDDCRKLIDYWSSPDRKVSPRTVGTYCKAFLQMIKWADAEEVCGFKMPKIHGLFQFRNSRGEIQRFDPVTMRKMLAAATERCRLYLLLGLNTGYTQTDIAHLTTDEIIVIGDDTFLVRRRDKTSHQNDFRTQHYLWPETAFLFRKAVAEANDRRHLALPTNRRLALLNVNGRPLVHGSVDNIRDSIVEMRDTAGIPEFTFKQLRKFGVSAVRRLTMNQDIARLYAAHRIAGALSHYDRDDCFDPLTSALKKWREELTGQGVFAPLNDSASSTT